MKNLKKYYEFFDTEDFKNKHDIDLLSNVLNPIDVLKDFNNQKFLTTLINVLSYKYPFFNEVFDSNDYVNLTLGEDGTYFFNFKNEQCKVSVGFNRLYKGYYDFSIIYIPNGVDPIKNNIISYTKLLDIYKNTAVYQVFKNIKFDDIYYKIDTILIPIMKEFNFYNLINIKKDKYLYNKN